MTNFLKTFLRDETGASAAEYALIIAIVGVGIGAAALALGANVKEAIGNASDDVYACNHSTATTGQADYNDVECTAAASTGG
jgi:pilus assembly protein Flp/PilA